MKKSHQDFFTCMVILTCYVLSDCLSFNCWGFVISLITPPQIIYVSTVVETRGFYRRRSSVHDFLWKHFVEANRSTSNAADRFPNINCSGRQKKKINKQFGLKHYIYINTSFSQQNRIYNAISIPIKTMMRHIKWQSNSDWLLKFFFLNYTLRGVFNFFEVLYLLFIFLSFI